MFDIRHIPHPTDVATYADAALREALVLGRRHDAEVHVLHVVPALGDDPTRGAFAVRADQEPSTVSGGGRPTSTCGACWRQTRPTA